MDKLAIIKERLLVAIEGVTSIEKLRLTILKTQLLYPICFNVDLITDEESFFKEFNSLERDYVVFKSDIQNALTTKGLPEQQLDELLLLLSGLTLREMIQSPVLLEEYESWLTANPIEE